MRHGRGLGRLGRLEAIEVVDLVWKGLRQSIGAFVEQPFAQIEVVDLVWKGLRLDEGRRVDRPSRRIEVVDLVWKGLRHAVTVIPPELRPIEVVDLVWKGLRHESHFEIGVLLKELKSLTWFGRDCDTTIPASDSGTRNKIEVVDLVWKGLRHTVFDGFQNELFSPLKSLTWFGRDCDFLISTPAVFRLTD